MALLIVGADDENSGGGEARDQRGGEDATDSWLLVIASTLWVLPCLRCRLAHLCVIVGLAVSQ